MVNNRINTDGQYKKQNMDPIRSFQKRLQYKCLRRFKITSSFNKDTARLKYAVTVFFFLSLLLLPLQNKVLGEIPKQSSAVQPIILDITTHLGDNQTFMEGDTISFYISLDSDAYLLLIYENASNQLVQIIPNTSKKSNFYKAGLFINIPGKSDDFYFKVQAPFGDEILWAFASDSQFPEIKGNKLSNGLKQLGMDIFTIKSEIFKQNISEFGEAKLLFRTKGYGK